MLVLNRRLKLKRAQRGSVATPVPVRVLLVIADPLPEKDAPLPQVQFQNALNTTTSLSDKVLVGNEKHVVDLVPLKETRAGILPMTSDYQARATRKAFEQAVVQYEPDIIHFIGHGRRTEGKGQLAFVGPNGLPQWVDDVDFARCARNSPNLKLVFVQACESGLADPRASVSGVARKLAHYDVPAVVAMQAKVENQVANDFAGGFYEKLARGSSVDSAVLSGRDRINENRTAQQLAFSIPVLYLRSHDPFIDLRETTAPPSVAAVKPVDTRPRCPRPGCREERWRPDQKFCTKCGLGFFCPAKDKDTGLVCGKEYDNPLGQRCGYCKARIAQEPYEPEPPAESSTPFKPSDAGARTPSLGSPFQQPPQEQKTTSATDTGQDQASTLEVIPQTRVA